ncbi:MAG: recombinase family protein, partial [Firmicutes bacterium]|nr:recombinase family protein [Bacillota bacterium]
MKQFVALARVSSREQEREGFSLEVQEDALKRYATQAGGEIVKFFKISETASKGDERKTFRELIAYAKKKIADGTLGRPVSVMVSRHLSRNLGKKIASRVRLSPAAMESTHDLDFVFWLLEPAKPVRVYSQGAYGYMQPVNGSYDIMWTLVTMDNGVLVSIGGGWNLPPSYPNYCATWIEITGTEGSLFLDDTQRDNWLNTLKEGTQ